MNDDNRTQAQKDYQAAIKEVIARKHPVPDDFTATLTVDASGKGKLFWFPSGRGWHWIPHTHG